MERGTMAFERGSMLRGVAAGVLALSVLGVGACSSNKPPKTFTSQSEEPGFRPFGLFKKSPKAATSEGSIGVNGFLWRASLDTLAFMPLASADPYGGVIVTDWYINPEKPDERFKATVYILDTRLRADGLNVTIFKQAKDASGAWADTAASDQTATDIENAILTRARQLRLSNIRN
ncbi:DUF3576 domain-containing protein [Caulobacter endophyticus]|uniref:DUF3576 domain-containing protein n=1 Tax=Caulobacter endophyticus TaxID=2172652 RepID=UPI00240EB3A9|nr:DUF3576 domain-containing protein [Caulobacter endophyticus]MDG2531637.1 DUF3576 domain-containing protein [Caulobacter endophyticus]